MTLSLITTEFIYEQAPFPECHASTLAESQGRIVAAWFGGSYERHPDVGIWTSRREEGRWSPPVEVANGVENAETRYPCWNPVLFQPAEGPLLLFYKAGPSPQSWWGVRMTSEDGGKSWSPPERLPEGVLGPIKNKPIQLPSGDLLCPSSTETPTYSWNVHFERTSDLGRAWRSTPSLLDAGDYQAIQPTLLVHPTGRLQALCRSRQGGIVESFSEDDGETWTPLQPTGLPNPDSGIDAVTLADGRHLLVHNPTMEGRTPLSVALSRDGGNWREALVLESEPGEYSYPAVIQASDGAVHIAYTWHRRRIRYAAIDLH